MFDTMTCMEGAGELEHEVTHVEGRPAFADELTVIAGAAQALNTADLTVIAPQQLGDLLQRVEAVRALVDYAASAVLARFDAEGACSYDGLRSTNSWLTQRCQMTSKSASRRLRTARALRHLPEVADGFRSGRFSADQADLFARSRNDRTAEAMTEDEAALAALADRLRPDDFGRELRGWAEMVDTDGAEPDRGHRDRSFSLLQTLDDTWTGRLDLASADGAFLHASVEAMAQALRREQEAGSAVRGDADGRADDDGVRRSPAQRRADALLELVRRGIDPASFLGRGATDPVDAADPVDPAGSGCADGGGGPAATQDGSAPADPPRRARRGARLPVSLHLLLDAGDLEAGRGADTLDGHHLTPSATDRQHGDAAIIAVLKDPFSGGVLDLGRRRRVVSPAQWAALAIRDGGCSFPGCSAPPQDCEAHHIVHWRHGGPTDIDNLTLTCWATHHKAVHEAGWQVVATARGRPRWFRPDGSEVDPVPGWESHLSDLSPPVRIGVAGASHEQDERAAAARATTMRRRSRAPDGPHDRRTTGRARTDTGTEELDEDQLELIRLARERAHALRHAA
jgi:hypothetical protein